MYLGGFRGPSTHQLLGVHDYTNNGHPWDGFRERTNDLCSKQSYNGPSTVAALPTLGAGLSTVLSWTRPRESPY